MAKDTAEIRLGQCEITFDSQDMGHTKGGVEITMTNDVYEVTVDAYGSTPAKAFDVGMRVEIKTTLTQWSYDILKKVLPQATKIEGTGGTPHDAVTFGKAAGSELAGGELTLHPIDGDAGGDDDVVFHKVVAIGDVKLPFKIDSETVYEVTLLALVDESQEDGELIGKLGVETGA